jgi:hypothetical protein
MQYPIYFWNIQIQQLQHTSEDSWNTQNMLMKQMKKHIKNTWKPLQSDANIQIKHM